MDIPSYSQLKKDLKQAGVADSDLEEALKKRVSEVVSVEVINQMKHFDANFSEYREKRARGDAYSEFSVIKKWESSLSGIMELTDIVASYCQKHSNYILEVSGSDDLEPIETVLIYMLPRAILVTREVIHLLRGGYPDGAMARWRTLHEMMVSAYYMHFCDETAAEKYLTSMKFAERTRFEEAIRTSSEVTVTDDISAHLKLLKKDCGEAMQRYSLASRGDGLWPKIVGFDSFKQMEKAIGFSGARSNYAMASEWIHAIVVPESRMLASVKGNKAGFLAGSSIEGFDVPCRMAGACIAHLGIIFLSQRTDVASEVMMRLIDILLDTLFETLEKDAEGEISIEELKEILPNLGKDFKLHPLEE